MKEFVKTQKVTYNLMSFTGFKALLIFSMLTEGPKSFEEIAEQIANHPYLNEEMSTDTIRVYMNSLKRIGCTIKRVKGDDKISRYMIVSNPFELNFTPEELQTVARVYKSLVQRMDIQDLIFMDNLFEKIGKYIKNENFIFKMRKISMLQGVDKELLTKLIDCCDKKLQIIIKYKSPNSGEKNIELITNKIDISSGKIYLYAYGFEYEQDAIFLLSRIKDIVEIKQNDDTKNLKKEVRVIYEIKTEKYFPDDNETIIEQTPEHVVIENITTNPFLLRQKLLEIGPSCTIKAPEEFKNEFINILQDMKAGYCND